MVFSLEKNLFTWKANVQCLYLENSKRSDPWEELQSSAYINSRPSYFIYFQGHSLWEVRAAGCWMGGKEGSWSHQRCVVRSSRINQIESRARGHLIGDRCGMKISLSSARGNAGQGVVSYVIRS